MTPQAIRVLGWAILLISLTFPVEGRTFTNKDGRSLEGEIVGVDAETVTLRVNGKTFAIPIGTLIEADQEHIRSWEGPREAGRFDCRVTESEEAGSLVTKRDSDEKVVESKRKFQITITNRSGIDHGPIEVKYNIISRWEKTSQKTRESGTEKISGFGIASGSTSLRGLKNGEKAVAMTEPVAVKSRIWKQARTIFLASGGTANEWDNYSEKLSVEGIWVKVFSGTEMVAEWKEGAATKDEVKWSDTSISAQETAGKNAGPRFTHADLDPAPQIPDSLKNDRSIRDLEFKVLQAATDYSNMVYREEKRGDVMDQKRLYKTLLEQFKAAIGSVTE